MASMSPAAFERVIDINLIGVWRRTEADFRVEALREAAARPRATAQLLGVAVNANMSGWCPLRAVAHQGRLASISMTQQWSPAWAQTEWLLLIWRIGRFGS